MKLNPILKILFSKNTHFLKINKNTLLSTEILQEGERKKIKKYKNCVQVTFSFCHWDIIYEIVVFWKNDGLENIYIK